MAGDPGVECDKLFRVFARWVDDALVGRTLGLPEEAAITCAQLRCLDFLARHDLCSVGDISEGLAISDPAATKLIDRLQRKGLVGRRGNRDDRRIVHVRLSDSGAGLVGRLGRKRTSFMDAAVEGLATRRLQMLLRLMESVLMSALDCPEVIARVCLRCGNDHSSDCVVNRAHVVATGVSIFGR